MSKSNDKYHPKFSSKPPAKKALLPEALKNILNNYESSIPASRKIGNKNESANFKTDKSVENKTADLLSKDEVAFENKIGVEDARRAISQLIESGDISKNIFNVIYRGNRFMPIEGVLLDYKRDLPRIKSAQYKIVKQILCFHNTYGGYLIFGVEEVVKDIDIFPVYKELGEFDFKTIRDICREILTSPIEIQAERHYIVKDSESFEIAILHIPARKIRIPILPRKEIKDEEGKVLLGRDEAYLREGDNSISAKTFHHWRLLFGPRENPYLKNTEVLANNIRAIYSDLPDRDFICPNFIGRQEYLSKLFSWLTDDFACVRVLAGEGGLGKTSIAFQFASEVAKSNLLDADSVIWLTAKKYQFRAITNEYEELVNCHFSSSRELFELLATNFGEMPENLEGVEDRDLPKILYGLSKHFKVFFVIDDLDTLEIDEQRRCIEVCQALAGFGSRFLFTTRKNATASTSTAIEVEGLEEEDYTKLIASWQNRLKIKEISSKDIRRLHDTTHGSPLYTESLLRLVKSGMPVGEAIAKWKGNLGVDVRNAALKREITQLGQEARKVLVTAAILGECSLAEIKVNTGYSDQTLLDATNELQSLFLLNAPAIAAQPRFSLAKTTKDLVIALGAELISDFGAFQERVRSKRLRSKGENASINAVGIAVNQAMALIAAGNPESALQTVDEVSQSLKYKNKDLWFLRGRVLLKFTKPRLGEAKDAFMKAFDLGQRKAQFFAMWYDTAVDLAQYEGAVEIATSAIESSSGEKSEWLIKRANARLRSAGLQNTRGDIEHAVNQLDNAADDFAMAASTDASLRWDSAWQESFYRTHDSLWAVATRSGNSLPQWVEAFDIQGRAIKRGDTRLECFTRMNTAFESMKRLVSRDSKGTQKAENLLSQFMRQGKEVFKDAPKEYKAYRNFRLMEISFGTVAYKS